MNDSRKQLNELEKRILEFNSISLVVIGEGTGAKVYHSWAAQKGLEVVFFDFQNSEGHAVDEKNIVRLSGSAFTHEHKTHIYKSRCFLIEKCSAALLEELLYLAKPFSRIFVTGDINEILSNVDLYSTIHYKNLELSFIPKPPGSERDMSFQ